MHTFYCFSPSAGPCVLVNRSSLLLPFLPLPLCLIDFMAASCWSWRISVLGPVSSLIWARINNSEKTGCCSHSLRYSQLSICSLGRGGSMPTASRTLGDFICKLWGQKLIYMNWGFCQISEYSCVCGDSMKMVNRHLTNNKWMPDTCQSSWWLKY